MMEGTLTGGEAAKESDIERNAREQAEKEARIKKVEKALKFLDLDSASEDPPIFDINYDNGERGSGRTLILLGEFALHARMFGRSTGKQYSERFAQIKAKTEHDVTLTILRQDIGAILMVRHEIDWEGVPPAGIDEPAREKYNYTVDIYHTHGHLSVPGLQRDYATTLKKTVYAWRTFNNNIIAIPFP